MFRKVRVFHWPSVLILRSFKAATSNSNLLKTEGLCKNKSSTPSGIHPESVGQMSAPQLM